MTQLSKQLDSFLDAYDLSDLSEEEERILFPTYWWHRGARVHLWYLSELNKRYVIPYLLDSVDDSYCLIGRINQGSINGIPFLSCLSLDNEYLCSVYDNLKCASPVTNEGIHDYLPSHPIEAVLETRNINEYKTFSKNLSGIHTLHQICNEGLLNCDYQVFVWFSPSAIMHRLVDTSATSAALQDTLRPTLMTMTSSMMYILALLFMN